MQCKYKTNYDDVIYDPFTSMPYQIPFQCDQEAIKEGEFCIFHDGGFYTHEENLLTLKNKLNEKIQESLKNNTELICVQYKIPEITINATFRKKVVFDRSIFLGKLQIRSIFCDIASFQECRFQGGVDFSYSHFYDFAPFSNSHFFGRVYYHHVIFRDAIFNKVQFESRIEFTYSLFYSTVEFVVCKLSDPYFWETTFNGDLRIYSCSITGIPVFRINVFEQTEIGFNNISHDKRVHVAFSSSIFRGSTRFQGNTFSGVCHMNDIKFYGYTLFEECKFDIVNFFKSKFRSQIDFKNCQFHNRTNFKELEVFDDANFQSLTFDSLADFSDSRFDKLTDFSDSRLNRSNFILTTFNKSNFARTVFGEVYFKRTRFRDDTKFNFTFFLDPEKAIFDSVDLDNVSFLYSDITRIKFDNVKWSNTKDYFRIYEERILENELDKNKEHMFDFSLEDLLALYRNLRENYEYRLKYDEAGRFFLREMEVRRKYEDVDI